MAEITVKAKITAGFHPGINANIVEGQQYTIDENKFGDQLFERPSPDWLAPWERGKPEVPATDSDQSGEVLITKKEGKKK